MGTAEAMRTRCPRCASEDRHDVTSLESINRTYICGGCSFVYQVIPFRYADSIHALEGPAVPTADQILEAAGTPSWLLP